MQSHQGGRRHHLEESLALWERCEEQARICQAWLDGPRERLGAATEAYQG